MNNSEALASYITKEKKADLIQKIVCRLCREKDGYNDININCTSSYYCFLKIVRWLDEDLKDKFDIKEELKKFKGGTYDNWCY